jgi:hypothetical protein
MLDMKNVQLTYIVRDILDYVRTICNVRSNLMTTKLITYYI